MFKPGAKKIGQQIPYIVSTVFWGSYVRASGVHPRPFAILGFWGGICHQKVFINFQSMCRC